MSQFGGIVYTPDRFTGGDDPATTIKVLAQREAVMHHQANKVMNLLAAAIRQNGGPIIVSRENQDAVPDRFGIHFTHDAEGALHLEIVDSHLGLTPLPNEPVSPANETEPTEKELTDDGELEGNASN